MSNQKHTPLPWHRHAMESHTICGPDHVAIGVFDATHRSEEENAANVTLCLEAPDLFAENERLKVRLSEMFRLAIGGEGETHWYYRDQYRVVETDNKTLRARIDELGDHLATAQAGNKLQSLRIDELETDVKRWRDRSYGNRGIATRLGESKLLLEAAIDKINGDMSGKIIAQKVEIETLTAKVSELETEIHDVRMTGIDALNKLSRLREKVDDNSNHILSAVVGFSNDVALGTAGDKLTATLTVCRNSANTLRAALAETEGE